MTSELNSLRHWLISWFFFTASIRYLAEWMVNGYPSENVWPLDLKRFGTLQSSRTFLRHRVMEVMRKWGLCLQCSPGCPRLALCCAVCSLSTVTTLRNIVLLLASPGTRLFLPRRRQRLLALLAAFLPAFLKEMLLVGCCFLFIYVPIRRRFVCICVGLQPNKTIPRS